MRREADCPLCGARLSALEVLDACEELVAGEGGVLGGRCPYCQGYLEVKPESGVVRIGYLSGGRFDTVRELPCEGLAVLRAVDSGVLALSALGRHWRFAP